MLILPLQDEFGWSRGHDLGRRLGQPGAVRPDGAVRRRADGPVRHPPGGRWRAAAGRGRQRPDRLHDRELAAGPAAGACWSASAPARWRWRSSATVAGRWFVTRRGLVTGVLTAGGAAGQLVFLPLLARAGRATHGWRTAALVVAGAALAVVPLVLLLLRDHPARPGPAAVRRDRGRDVAAAGAPAPARRRACAALLRGRAGRGVLAAGRRLRDLRRDHQRPGRHPLHPGRARPRHGRDHRGRPARAGRPLRHRRHDRLGLADRPGRPAGSCSAATTPCAGCRCWCCRRCSPATVQPSMLVFIVFYGLDWVATVPPTVALCREFFGDGGPVVFGWVFAVAPDRRGDRRHRRRRGPRPLGHVRPGLVRRRRRCASLAAAMSLAIRQAVPELPCPPPSDR